MSTSLYTTLTISAFVMYILTKISKRSHKILFLLLLACACTSHNHGAQAAFATVKSTLTTHGQTISNGAIWVVDTVYLLGKLFPNKISNSVTSSALATLNYISLCALGFYLAQIKEYANVALKASPKDDKLTRCVAGTQSFCTSVTAIDTIASALAATYAARGKTKSASNIYATMRPWAETAFILTILIDIYHLTQKDTPKRLNGSSDLALKGLGYMSIALCRRNPDSLTQASCWWSMATLYGIKSWWFTPAPSSVA